MCFSVDWPGRIHCTVHPLASGAGSGTTAGRDFAAGRDTAFAAGRDAAFAAGRDAAFAAGRDAALAAGREAALGAAAAAVAAAAVLARCEAPADPPIHEGCVTFGLGAGALAGWDFARRDLRLALPVPALCAG